MSSIGKHTAGFGLKKAASIHHEKPNLKQTNKVYFHGAAIEIEAGDFFTIIFYGLCLFW